MDEYKCASNEPDNLRGRRPTVCPCKCIRDSVCLEEKQSNVAITDMNALECVPLVSKTPYTNLFNCKIGDPRHLKRI